MRTTFAVATVLTLVGTSYGFIATQFAVVPGGSITPSVGTFVDRTDYGEAFVNSGGVVDDSRSTWKGYGNYYLSTTWLGVDPAGGGVDIDGYTNSFSRVLDGIGSDPKVPQWCGSNSNSLGGDVLGATCGFVWGGSAILGGSAGFLWGAGYTDGFRATSSVSPVNGEPVDSLFFGYFVLEDPSATLVGDDLLMTIDIGGWMGENVFLPLDGTPTAQGYRIAYEEHVSPFGDTVLKGFVVVPGPGGMMCLLGAGVAAMRRRR